MTRAQTNPLASRGRRSPVFRRLLLFFACAFGVLVAALAVLIVPDQVRTVPELKAVQRGSGPKTGETDSALRAASVARDSRGDDNSTTDTTGTADATPAPEVSAAALPAFEGGADVVSLEEFQKRSRLVRDSSGISETTRRLMEEAENRPFAEIARSIDEKARIEGEKWNPATDDAATSLVLLAQNSDRMTFAEASLALLNLSREYHSIADRKWRLSGLPGGAPRFGGSPDWRDAYYRVLLKIAIEHEEWYAAAEVCMEAGGALRVNRRSPWWDREVYCRRQCGLQGRIGIAYRTYASAYDIIVQRARRMTASAVEPVYGPPQTGGRDR